jgi:hypothetical protein
LEGGELNAESGVLHRAGRMTAEEESHKTKQEQDEGRHEAWIIRPHMMKVKLVAGGRNIGEPQAWTVP